jgi:ketosteroid isomerase-like protein
MAENEDITATLYRWAAAEASGDAEAIAQCLSEDFLGVGPLGFILPRREWLQRHDPGGLDYEKFELQDIYLRLYGDTAVVTALVEQPGTYEGNPIPQRTRSTLLLVKQGRQWRITTHHMSFVAGTPGAPPVPGTPQRS